MDIKDPKMVVLLAAVTAAQEEFDLAVTFHEMWKPAAFDKQLHERMGISYATNGFHVARVALQRETLLALMRLWDTTAKALRLDEIGRTLRDANVISALAADRASRAGFGDLLQAMRADLQGKADEAIRIIDQYSRTGAKFSVLDSLRTLRHERLAHRKLRSAQAPDHTDEDVEALYQDMARLVNLLLSLVNATAYDPTETATIYSRYAELFWSSVRGERTEGHPSYRPHPTASDEQQ